MWLLMLVYILWVRRAFAVRRRTGLGTATPPTVTEVKDVIRTDGGGTLSWMTTWSDMSYATIAGGVVGFQNRRGVAIALGDPLGPEAGRPDVVRGFIDAAERAALPRCRRRHDRRSSWSGVQGQGVELGAVLPEPR